jgi:hypothetical protein
MKFFIGIFILFGVAQTTVAQGNAVNVEPEKQAFCKGAPIPPDRVVVSGFVSAACSPPDTENAWDTVVPADGTIACRLHDSMPTEQYDWKAAGNVLQLSTCEEVHSNECPKRLDGGENAIVLRSPASCLRHGLTEMRVQCVDNLKLPKYDFVVAITNNDKCKDAHDERFSGNAFIIQTWEALDKPFSFCAPLRGPLGGEPPFRELEWDEAIVRRFHSDYCPDFKFVNYEKGLNAISVIRLRNTPDPALTLCIESSIARTHGMAETSTSDNFFYAEDRKTYVRDDLCGGRAIHTQAGVNGARIKSSGNAADVDPWGNY